MFGLSPYLLIGALVGAIALTGAGYFKGRSDANGNCKLTINAMHDASETQGKEAQKKISELDAKHTQDMENAKKDFERIVADIRAGTRSVSVKVRNCRASPSSGTGVDHGTSDAELDASTLEWAVGLTNEGDNAIRKLTAAQDVILSRPECFLVVVPPQ